MFEVRTKGSMHRIYDRENDRYVAHTRNYTKASLYCSKYLKSRGFQGDIPAFFLNGCEDGIDLDYIF